jgi:hypothetical protein
VSFLIQWEAKVPGASANSYRYAVSNDLGRPVELSLRLEGAGSIQGEKDIRLGPLERKTGRVIVREEGMAGGSVTFVAEGREISLRRKAGFP